MQFEVEAGVLGRALHAVKGGVAARTTIPILSHVMVGAADGRITVSANNLTIAAETRIAGDVRAPGAYAFPGEVLAGLVKRFGKSQAVGLAVTDGGRAALTCGRARYDLRWLPADEFPRMAEIGDGPAWTMPAATLKAMIEASRYAIDGDDTRPYLCGMQLDIGGSKLNAVGTDGKRLAWYAADMPDGIDALASIIVPDQALREMVALIGDAGGDVACATDGVRLSVRVGDATVTTLLIEGTFPRYQALVPARTKGAAVVRPSALAEVIERAMVVFSGANEKAPAVTLTVVPNGIAIEAGGGALDGAREHVHAEPITVGQTLTVNIRFLLDALKAVPDVDCVLQPAADPMGPAILHAAERPEHLHLIMPQRK